MKYLQIAMAFLFLTISSCKTGENEKSIKTPTQQELIKTETNNLENNTLVSNKKDSIKTKYKINNLPISYNYENDFMQITLPVTWADIKIDTSYEDTFLAMLPKKKKFQPVIYTGVYAFGNSEEFLLILDKNNKEISRIRLYYNDAPDGNVEEYSYSTYQINDNYIIKVTTYKVTLDSNDKIIKKESSDMHYFLNNKGLIVEKR